MGVRVVSKKFGKPFNPIRPIYVMCTEGVTPEEQKAALEALVEILYIAGVSGKIPVRNLGVWRNKDFVNEKGSLLPHQSVDWYVLSCLNSKRKQVNASQVMRHLEEDPWYQKERHYDIILTDLDLYIPDTNFVVGLAWPTRATIISTYRFRNIRNEALRREAIKQEVYHEVGHVFGLPNSRRFDLERSLGLHCRNPGCAMRQGLHVPHDWIKYTLERLDSGIIYCRACERDLKEFFQHPF